MKKAYLVAYNYGMGGAWALVYARSEQEVIEKYPEAEVVRERPSWMDDKYYANLLSTSAYDIDDKPSGWLKVLVSKRH